MSAPTTRWSTSTLIFKTVTVQTPNGEIMESYDKLILSPGAKPVIPPLKGIAEAENLFTLRNVPDLDKIMAKLEQINSGKAVVIGAGFIGLEMAENLALKGLTVTLVEQAPHVLPTFDLEMARYIETELSEKGVHVITGQSVTAFMIRDKY